MTELWTLVFNRRAATRWCSLVALGPHKHVRAFRYVAGLRVWLFYDVRFSGTHLAVVEDGPRAHAAIDTWITDADVVVMERKPGGQSGPRLGFFCVPAVKHLLGLKTGALRPTALFRHCLANGGRLIDGPTEDGRAETRPHAAVARRAGDAGS